MSVSLCQRHLWSTDCQFMSVSLCESETPLEYRLSVHVCFSVRDTFGVQTVSSCLFLCVSDTFGVQTVSSCLFLCERHLWSTDCQFMSVSLCESETPLEYRLSVHVCFSVRDTFGVQTVSSCLFLCVSQRHLWSTDCQFMSVSL